MENEYIFHVLWKVFWAVVVVGGAVCAALRKVKEKRKLNDLAMYAIVEVEKQKWKEDEKEHLVSKYVV